MFVGSREPEFVEISEEGVVLEIKGVVLEFGVEGGGSLTQSLRI